jgi:RNA polymerase sigma-70 factor (ECF subfamily)
LEAPATYLLGLRSPNQTEKRAVLSPLCGGESAADCQTLLERIATGDAEAWPELFRRYARQVHRVGHRILQDAGEAEELVQEVFLYIHRKSKLFDKEKSSARSWIFQIAYTQAFLRRRRLKARGFYSTGVVEGELEADRGTTCGLQYDLSVEGIFGPTGWRKILDALTAEQRETLRLHFFEGYTFTEIAEKLGQSFANVRNHHYRGLEKLRKYLVNSKSNRR